jgi:Uncharacterized conserved protein (DUF2278)
MTQTRIEDWVFDLLRALRNSKYVVTGEDCSRVTLVVDQFLKRSPKVDIINNADDRRYLEQLIGPIVSSSPMQQGAFHSIFEDCFQRHFTPGPGHNKAVGASIQKSSQPPGDPGKDTKKSKRMALGALVLVIVVLVPAFYYFSIPPTKTEQLTEAIAADTSTLANDSTAKLLPPEILFNDLFFKDVPPQFVYHANIWAWLAVAAIASVIVSRLLHIVLFVEPKETYKATGPYNFSLGTVEHQVQASTDFVEFGKKLQQREEGNSRILDLSSSIFSTVRKGGIPTINFKTRKHRPHYLFMVDSRSPFDQRTKLYTYMVNLLDHEGIDLDVFYYHTTPHVCWNARNAQGVQTDVLQQRYLKSYVILVTEGFGLLHQNKVSSWVIRLFEGWKKRAVLTPRPMAEWGSIEKVLGEFFVVLPISSTAMAYLRRMMDGERLDTPVLRTITQNFVGSEELLRKQLDDLTVTDIEKNITLQAGDPARKSKITNTLILWAFATAVSTKASLEITTAIGKAIERTLKVSGLVTTANLLIITTLPWLKQEQISTALYERLLTRLRELDKSGNTQVEQSAREALIALLSSTTVTEGTRAFQEREISLNEQYFHSTLKEHHTRTALNKLRSYQKAGLIHDKSLSDTVSKKYSFIKWGNISLVLLVLMGLTGAIPDQKGVGSSSLLGIFYEKDKDAVDSAAYYNSAAMNVYEQAEYGNSSYFPEYYPDILRNLLASMRYRTTPEAYRNLAILRSEAISFEASEGATELATEGLEDIPNFLAPFHDIDYKWVPSCEVLEDYFNVLSEMKEVEQVKEYIDKLIPIGYKAPAITSMSILVAKRIVDKNWMMIPRAVFGSRDSSIRVEIPQEMLAEMRSFRAKLQCQLVERYYKYEDDIIQTLGSSTPIPRDSTANDSTAVSTTTPPVTQVVPSDSVVTAELSTPRQTEAERLAIIRRNDSLRTKILKDSMLKVSEEIRRRQLEDSIRKAAETPPDQKLPAYVLMKGKVVGVDQRNGVTFTVEVGKDIYDIPLRLEQSLKPAIYVTGTEPKALGYYYNNRDAIYAIKNSSVENAIDYVRQPPGNLASRGSISAADLYKSILMRATWLKGATIYIWGDLAEQVNPTAEGVAKFTVTNIHMNQGSTASDLGKNLGPWHDGAVVILPPDAAKGADPIAIYIYYGYQTLDVDEKGNPR